MYKLIVLACVIAVAHGGAIGLGHGGAGYGYIGGLTKLPNLGFGNIASVNSNQNGLGYGYANFEHGPLSVRSHVQSQVAPLGIGIPVIHGYGLGYGYGLGHGGIIG